MESPPTALTVEDLQAAAPRVLARLREMASFPESGTVAGQAVASLFWEELGLPMRGPINDIDVFVSCNMPRAMRGIEPSAEQGARPPARSQATVSNYKGSRIKEDDYGNHRVLALRATTAILRTYTVGLVNYTLVTTGYRSPFFGHTLAQSQELVDEFDLNLVAVGINLDEGRVVASPAFLKFLGDRQVRAQTCNTPAHTMVRLVNKLHSGQLQSVECDYPTQRQMLELAIACQDKIVPVLSKEEGDSPKCITRFGSSKYRALAAQFAHLLPPTYTQVNASGYEFTHFEVEPASTPQAKWLLEQSVPLVSLDRTGLGRLAYVARFPVLYGLFHPELDGGLSPANSAERIESFKQALATDDPEAIFRLVHFALGKDIPDIAMQELSSLEATNFFFEQDMDKLQCASLARKWNALTPIEARVLGTTGMRATQFDQLCKDPQAGWEEIFARNNQAVYSALSKLRPPDSATRDASLLTERFLSWVASPEGGVLHSVAGMIMRDPMIFSARGYVKDVKIKLDTVFPPWSSGPSTATKLLWHLTQERREQLGSALVESRRKGWREGPYGNDLIPSMLTRIEMGLTVSESMVDQLVDQGLARDCVIDACRNIEIDDHSSAYETILTVVSRLEPAEVFDNQSQVLRSLAYTQRGTLMLHQIKEKLESDPGIGEAFASAIDFLDREISNYDDSDLAFGENPLAHLERTRAKIESWDLSRKTRLAAVAPSRSSPRF